MDESPSLSTHKERQQVGRLLLWILGIGFFLLLSACVFPFLIQGLFYLVIGWIPFFARTSQAMEWSGEGITLGVTSLVFFVGGLHWLLVSFVPQWQLKRTLALAGLFLLSAISGIGVTGAVHQVGWMLTSSELMVQFLNHRAASRSQSKNNLKQFGLAAHHFHDEHSKFPVGGQFNEYGHGQHSFFSLVQDYAEMRGTVNLDVPWDHPLNAEAIRTDYPATMSTYPGMPTHDSEGRGLSFYATNLHVSGPNHALSISDIPDGTSNTLLIGEVTENLRPWAHPHSFRDPLLGINKHPEGFGGPWVGGAQFTLADGSVRFIVEHIDPEVWKNLTMPNDGNKVGEY
ncbi:DUF1559 family PulG-like putative transporter [Calycomorphotria hydatis]|uniref:DUF1559 domain-containing protein n=1 Tax=Calycomorphotria hydatis TaxID=2528027 RepID=A0A517TEW2_9PLAN|nr:DUF1559 domain-containing protein [Calycomorphotria hydatis]QDT66905.1 hypothetical protein V22_41770 [Calycomorphotria hydatis]